MLQIRTYYKEEIERVMRTGSRQATTRKLNNYNVEYTITGRGNYCIEIINIPDIFKVFCILELGFYAQTDFTKLKEFMFYFFCDDDFRGLPDERKEKEMETYGKPVSRQTIGKWINKLEMQNLIHRSVDNIRYFFAYRDTIIDTNKEKYSEAWKNYWRDKNYLECCSGNAIGHMISTYGGVAKKHYVPVDNALYTDKINELIGYVTDSIADKNDF